MPLTGAEKQELKKQQQFLSDIQSRILKERTELTSEIYLMLRRSPSAEELLALKTKVEQLKEDLRFLRFLDLSKGSIRSFQIQVEALEYRLEEVNIC
jgi:deferrochelatase/peroxidase EfeB